MIATAARPFALGVDTVQRLTPVTASALRREGMAFVVAEWELRQGKKP